MDRKIAVQLHYPAACGEILKAAAECGFRYVSMSFGDQRDFFCQDGWETQILQLKETLDTLGMRCIMTHLPCYDMLISANENDDKMELALLRCIAATTMLGADLTAFHPRAYFYAKDLEDVDKSFLYNARNLIPLVEEAEKLSCRIGIENLPTYPDWSISFFSNFPEQHKRLVDVFHSPNVCAVWDFGHSHLSHDDQAAAIRLLGGRIQGTHVHNNFKVIDDHLPPSIGSINWDSVMTALKNTGFDGYLTAEIPLFGEAIPSYLAHVKECLENLDALIR